MKTPLLMACLAGSTALLAQEIDSSYYNVYELTFKGNDKEVVAIYDNPKDITDSYAEAALIQFTPYFGGGEGSVYGPFVLDLSFTQLLQDNDISIYGSFFYPIVDVGTLELDKEDRRMKRSYLETSVAYAFFDWEVEKERKVGFYDPDRQGEADYNTVVVHTSEFDIHVERQLQAKASLMRIQRPIHNNDLDTLFEEIDGYWTSVYGTRNLVFGVGLNLNKLIHIGTESEGFGSQDAFVYANTFVELLYSPTFKAYQVVEEFVDDCSCLTNGVESEVDASIALESTQIGWRAGMNRKSSLIRSKHLGSVYGFEVGMLPGVSSGSGYFQLNYALVYGF